MKSYTDLEQSKKLAEFLPLESVDMWYHGHYSLWESERKCENEPCPFHSISPNWDKPCWSLSALLGLMPKRYNGDNVYMPLVGRYYEGNHKFICGYFGDGLLDCTFGETSVDACVEMILKLHELNLL